MDWKDGWIDGDGVEGLYWEEERTRPIDVGVELEVLVDLELEWTTFGWTDHIQWFEVGQFEYGVG